MTVSAPSSPGHREWRGTGLYWTLIVGLVAAVAALIGIIQNSQSVELRYLVWSGSASLAVIMLAAVVVSVAGTVAIGAGWRRRRRRTLADRQELGRRRVLAGRPDVVAAPEIPEAAAPAK